MKYPFLIRFIKKTEIRIIKFFQKKDGYSVYLWVENP